jgi:N-acetylneuraminic acid mutarotase
MSKRSWGGTALILGMSALAACREETTAPNAVADKPAQMESAVAGNTWLTRANMGAWTDLAAATVTNAAGQSIVYAIGGLGPGGVPEDKVTAYNVATNTWTFRHRLPWPLARSNGAGVINGKIYVSGGYSDYGGDFPGWQLLMYDPATNTWTRKRDLPVVTSDGLRQYAMGDGVTGVINGKLYVVSGCFLANEPWGYDEDCNPLFFRYNPSTDRWVTLPSPFSEPTYGASIGGVIKGKFYVMGRSPYTHDARFAVYDPATKHWTAITPLGLSRPGAASAVLDGKLFVMGGTRYNASQDTFETLDITIVYDPITDAWTRRAPMPSPRARIAASQVLLNGQARIEVVGGSAPGNNLQYVP